MEYLGSLMMLLWALTGVHGVYAIKWGFYRLSWLLMDLHVALMEVDPLSWASRALT